MPQLIANKYCAFWVVIAFFLKIGMAGIPFLVPGSSLSNQVAHDPVIVKPNRKKERRSVSISIGNHCIPGEPEANPNSPAEARETDYHFHKALLCCEIMKSFPHRFTFKFRSFFTGPPSILSAFSPKTYLSLSLLRL